MKDVHSRSGGFDTIRLLAAFLVLHGHMYPIAGREQPKLLGAGLAGTAVIVFFVVSGYWVSQSATQRSTVSFAVARALRIFPGLAVCCAVTILLCALASSAPVNDYLARPATWSFMWNAVPFFHSAVMGMPGVFEQGPLKDAVNGSLWTLRYEVMCYVFLGAAAVFGRAGLRVFMAGAAVFALAVFAQALGSDPNKLNDRYIFLLDVLTLGWMATFLGAFAFGAWLRAAGDQWLGRILALSAVAFVFGFRDPAVSQATNVLFYGSLAVWAGRRFNLDRHVTRGQDLSFGVYIYAFPVQQLAARWIAPYEGGSFLLYYGVALGSTAALAALSWVLIERPALLLKNPVAGFLEGLLGGNRRDFAQKAGGLGPRIDSIDAHPVRGGGDGH